MAKTGDDKTAAKDGNGKHTGQEILKNKEPDLKELLGVARVDILNIQELLTNGRFDLTGKEAMELSNLRIRLGVALAPKKVAAKVPDKKTEPAKLATRKRT